MKAFVTSLMYALSLGLPAVSLNASPTSAETSPTPDSAQAAPSVASPSVQSAIAAAVEEDCKRYGGRTRS